MKRILFLVTFSLYLFLVISPTVRAASFDVIQLPLSSVSAINDHGQVVGRIGYSIVYWKEGNMRSFDTGDRWSHNEVRDINNNGKIAGRSADPEKAAIWDANNDFFKITYSGDGASSSTAERIADNNIAIVRPSYGAGMKIWNTNTNEVVSSPIHPNDLTGWPNRSETAVRTVGVVSHGLRNHAAYYDYDFETGAGVSHDIHDLLKDDLSINFSDSYIDRISDNGLFAGHISSGPYWKKTFVGTPESGFQLLAGGDDLAIRGINDWGWVIGKKGTDGFLLTDDEIINLDDVLDGYTSISPTDINNLGWIVAGAAWQDPDTGAYKNGTILIKPTGTPVPLPSSALLMASALGVGVFCRKKTIPKS